MKGKLPLVSGTAPPPSGPAETAIDPVCGMTVDPRTAAGSHVHGGRTYWFCATSCLERFRADPDRYLTRAGATASPVRASATAPPGGDFTCPMHPEVREPASS